MAVRRGWVIALLGIAAAVGSAPAPGAAQPKAGEANPLEPLGRLVGGYWLIEPGKPMNAYSAFTWGPNRRTLHATFYLVGDGKSDDPVRADAFYFWHPGKKKVCGIAAGASGEVYDGEITMDASGATQEFEYFTAQGTTSYRETWVFPDNDTYVWTLYRKAADGQKEQMKATFHRVKERPRAK